MFEKLKLSLSEIDFEKLKGNKILDNPTFKEFSLADRKYFFDIISNKVKFDILPHIINVTEIIYPGSKPHTDTWPTAVNIYFDTANAETSFWKEINSTPNSMRGIVSFDVSNLEKTSTFVAQKGDCYLLNVGRIHSVDMINSNSTRKIIRLGWFKYSFDEILNSIKIING
jgi:hypothetical protein